MRGRENNSRSRFLRLVFVVRFVAKRHILLQVSEAIKRIMPARNTLVQLSALYTNPKSLNVQRYRQTRTDRQTDRRTTGWCQYCVAVRSANNNSSRRSSSNSSSMVSSRRM